MAIWIILWPFGMFCPWPFRNLVPIWYIFPCFGTLNEEKSGSPGDANQDSGAWKAFSPYCLPNDHEVKVKSSPG
jgi:hypothetical protein